MTANLPIDLPPKRRKASLTRSASNRRTRHVQEILRGNARAFQHGIFAIVANEADVALEVAVTYAAHPLLDPIADFRLAQQFALALVQRMRALAAMQEYGLTAQLTSYDARLAALCERAERAIYEREKERATVAGQLPADLSRYLPRGDRHE